MFKYCATVILFQPEVTVLDYIQIYSLLFDKVFVIDNSNSVDEEIIKVLRSNNKVDYIPMNGNKGISKALNVAFYKAIDFGYEFILTMDQDSIYPVQNMQQMINYIEANFSEDIGIYASNYCRLFFNEKIKTTEVSDPRYKTNKVKKVLCAITSGSFVSINALKKIIPIDENYFIANVDIDLAAQMETKGYKTILVGNAIFHQQVGGNVNKSLISEKLRFTNYSSTRYYYQVRNTFYLKKKYHNKFNFRLFSYLQLIKYLFKICTSEQNKIQKIKLGYYGYQDYKKGIFGKKNEID